MVRTGEWNIAMTGFVLVLGLDNDTKRNYQMMRECLRNVGMLK